MSRFADFIYEVGILSNTPRSGLHFLGTGEQSVSEHIYRTLNIAFVLARLTEQPIDELHLMQMVLFHDLPEARASDLNWMNHRYVRVDTERLFADLRSDLPFGEEIIALVREFEDRTSPEACIAHDADQLEFLVTLREQVDRGNPQARAWIPPVLARLTTTAAQKLAEEIMDTPSDEWWFKDKSDSYWVNRQGSKAEDGILPQKLPRR